MLNWFRIIALLRTDVFKGVSMIYEFFPEEVSIIVPEEKRPYVLSIMNGESYQRLLSALSDLNLDAAAFCDIADKERLDLYLIFMWTIEVTNIGKGKRPFLSQKEYSILYSKESDSLLKTKTKEMVAKIGSSSLKSIVEYSEGL